MFFWTQRWAFFQRWVSLPLTLGGLLSGSSACEYTDTFPWIVWEESMTVNLVFKGQSIIWQVRKIYERLRKDVEVEMTRHIHAAMRGIPCFYKATCSRKKTEWSQISSLSFSVLMYKMRTAILWLLSRRQYYKENSTVINTNA